MTEELAVIEQFDALAVRRAPEVVLDEARKAAKALTTVIEGKKKKLTFNGETYLENEDWLTVARFYGVTSRIRSTNYIEYGDVRGFEATAEAYLVGSGDVISTSESMCLDDEPNWTKKPLFQLRSMAQTRASSRVLRQVFGWVVVLAGYKATPAEEMDGVVAGTPKYGKPKTTPASDVMCNECRAINGHLPSCIHRKQPEAAPTVPQAAPTAPKASPTPTQTVEAPQTPANEEMALLCKTITEKSRATKDGKKKTYLVLSVVDSHNGEWDLYVWDKKVAELAAKLGGKTFIGMISQKKSGGRVFCALESIVEVAGEPLGDICPLDNPPE